MSTMQANMSTEGKCDKMLSMNITSKALIGSAASVLVLSGAVAPAAFAASGHHHHNKAHRSISVSCDNATVVAPTGTDAKSEDLGMKSNPEIDKLLKDKSIKWESSASCKKIKHSGKTKAVKKTKKVYASSINTFNWAGAVAKSSAHPYANYAQTAYVEPSVSTSVPGKQSLSAVWAGIGGVNDSTLVQAGTIQFANDNGTQSHQMWWEVYPDDALVALTNIAVKPGDQVFTSSSWKGGSASFALCNLTAKKCVNVQKSKIAQPGNTAEFIVEKPMLADGTKSPLAKFAPIKMTRNMWQMDSTGKPMHGIDGFSDMASILGSNGKTVDATPSAISNQEFTVTWKAADN